MSLTRSLLSDLLFGNRDFEYPTYQRGYYYPDDEDYCLTPVIRIRYRDPAQSVAHRGGKAGLQGRCEGGRGVSHVTNDADKFQVLLDVQHFAPNEIEVKTVDNSVVVHGKHEERPDEHGFISREFTRRYVLPEGVEVDKVASSLTSQGILTIEAPRKRPENKLKGNERVIPIRVQHTPAAPVTNTPSGDASHEPNTQQQNAESEN